MKPAAAILAGGRGLRLGGVDKPLLRVGGQRIIDIQLAVLRPLVGEIVISANSDAYAGLGLPVIGDEQVGQGPLAGLLAVLEAVSAEVVLVVAGDMPALAPAPLELLLAARDADVVCPRIGGRPEPLCARYRRALAPTIRARLAVGERALHTLLAAVDTLYLDETCFADLGFLRNLNTPEDLPPL
jgi:molybdopterin-guanine dinucleotide biosynthesis protein A